MNLQDSAAVGIPATGGTLSWGWNILLGAGAALGTKLVSAGAARLDRALSFADERIRRGLGPALPVVVAGWAVALPLLGNALGVTELPPADVMANSPLAAVTGIVLREAGRRWVLPLVRGR